jgi:hypothetical protein
MDKVIVKTGEIFTAGSYPDKKFKLTADELPLVVQQFKAPVSLDLDHKTTIQRLDSKLGKLTSIWHKDDKIFGRVEIPEWLNNVACKDEEGNDLPLQVSCAFGPDKAIKKLALTDNPRVPTAAVFAAFSAVHPTEAEEVKEELISVGAGELANEGQFSSELVKELVEFAKKNVKTHEGQSVLQQVHDILARSGAICNPDTELHSASELSAIQAAHDEIVSSGAVCRALKEGERPIWFSAELSGQTADDKTKGENMDSDRLSFVQEILKFINKDGTAAPAQEATTLSTGAVAGMLVEPKEEVELASPEVAALRAELEAEKKKTERLIADGIAAQSKMLANEIIVGKHAQEKDRALLERNFAQALQDDQSNPVEIQFSDNSKGGRVDMLKATYLSREIVPLTEETVKEEELETLLSAESRDNKDESAKRLEAVKERAIKLAERKNARLRK